jgi:hypothetical protein
LIRTRRAARVEKILHADEENVVAVILRIGAEREQVGYGVRGNSLQCPIIGMVFLEQIAELQAQGLAIWIVESQFDLVRWANCSTCITPVNSPTFARCNTTKREVSVMSIGGKYKVILGAAVLALVCVETAFAETYYGSQLMSHTERAEHRATMWSLSPSEREAYRAEHYEAMKKRAESMGLSLTDQPPTYGPGFGRGGPGYAYGSGGSGY